MFAAASMLALGSGAAHAVPVLFPSGPVAGLTTANILAGGWSQCYSGTMSAIIGSSGEAVLNACNGDYLMMAGRRTGSNEFLIAAAALRADTIVDTGKSSNTNLANGSQWWYSPNWSWGFTAAGDTVDNFECDTSASPASMCLHTLSFVGGYRINDTQDLNGSTDFEKVFFVSNGGGTPVPEPGTLALVGLGLLGLASRRKTAA
jgi:hypothetical protein